MTNSKALAKVEKLLALYKFTNDLGEVIQWSPGQKEIMAAIVGHGVQVEDRFFNFVQLETITQYGKSSAIAAALVMLTTTKDKWAIVAGTDAKAQIIMSYFIHFALENPLCRSLLKTKESLDKLEHSKSKTKLNFSSGFEVEVFTAAADNRSAAGNAIMGFGAPNVIQDEASLVDDVVDSKIQRMVGGYSTVRHCLIKVGNPFYRNHFYKTHNDPDYHVIRITGTQAVREGRISQEFIDKARTRPNFDVLYGPDFPSESSQDLHGWIPLLTTEDIARAQASGPLAGFGALRFGVDVAGGGRNESVVVKRFRNYAEVVLRTKTSDTMELVEQVISLVRQAGLPSQIFIDNVGIGKGAFDMLARSVENVVGVNGGLEPFSAGEFVNKRAEMYWFARQWLRAGGKLIKDEMWSQLLAMKYRTKLEGARGKLQLMSKEDMLKEGNESPDVADALAMTFSLPDLQLPEGNGNERELEEAFDPHGLFNAF